MPTKLKECSMQNKRKMNCNASRIERYDHTFTPISSYPLGPFSRQPVCAGWRRPDIILSCYKGGRAAPFNLLCVLRVECHGWRHTLDLPWLASSFGRHSRRRRRSFGRHSQTRRRCANPFVKTESAGRKLSFRPAGAPHVTHRSRSCGID